MIKLVVFDLWNTLVPTTVDWSHLVSLTKKEHFELGEFIERYERSTQLKRINSFDELRKAFFSAFDQFDNLLLEQELYEVFINRIDKISFFPDVENNLAKLKSQGYKIALLSNTENLAFDRVKNKTNLEKYFDFLCLSCDVGAIKPDKKMYNCVLKKSGFSPNEILMVGDSLRSDVTGAKNAGFHSCWINRPKKSFDLANIKPEFEIKTLDDIYRVLGVLNAGSNERNAKSK